MKNGRALTDMDQASASVCLPTIPTTAPAGFVPPPDACDAHVHVFGDLKAIASRVKRFDWSKQA